MAKARMTAGSPQESIRVAAMTGQPDVSIIVAAYNVAPYIETAVRSALLQRDVSVEVIVVDDASSDATADVVAAMAADDARIVLIRRETTGGPSTARNQAFAVARGRWLAILDGDDIISPNRSRCLIDLAESASAEMVADNFERVDIEGRPTGKTMFPTGEQPYSFLVGVATFITGNITFERSRFSLGAVKPMFRADFISAHAISYRQDLPIGEDYLICLVALREGARFVVTSHDFYKYRIRGGSQSWRLKEDHVERLLQAHAEAGIENRFEGDAEVTAAARRYVSALERTRTFVQIVGHAKCGRILRALYTAAVRPEVWPFVARFGAQAVAKRVWRPA
jgi:succinoglycan biosynthesis protein ExoO